MANNQETAESVAKLAESLEDISLRLERIIERLSSGGDKYVSSILSSTRTATDLSNILDHIADNFKDKIPKGIITGNDLQKRMITDAKLLNKIQKQSGEILENEINSNWQKILKHMKDTHKTQEQIDEAERKHQMASQFARKAQEREFALLKRQQQTLKSINLLIVNGKQQVDALEQGWRQPSARIEEYLNAADQLPEKLKKLKEQKKEFDKLGSSAKWAAARATALGLAYSSIVAGLTVAFKAFKNLYDFIDNEVLPSNANINREFGNLGSSMDPLRSQAVSTGLQFKQLGLSFEEGAASVRNIASAMMTTSLPKETLKEALKLSEYVGLGAEQAGKLMLQFDRAGISGQKAGELFKNAAKSAIDYGVPINQVRKDIGDNIDILQRFGIKNIKVMSESASKARAYGLTIREVNAAFGKQLDTFEGSSDAAAKLNSIFGTHINSYKLMLETDPTKRMEMLRKELLNQGKAWEKLNVFEKNVITSTLGVTEEQAALVLGNQKTIASIKNQMAEREKQAKVDAEWNRGLTNIKSTIVDLNTKVDLLLRAVADFVSELFGLGSASKNVVSWGEKFGGVIDSMTVSVRSFTKSQEMKDLKTFLSFMKESLQWIAENAGKALGSLNFIVKHAGQAVGAISAGADIGLSLFDPEEALKKLEKDKTRNAVAAGKAGVVGVEDALITKKGQVIKFNPEDNVLATKAPIGKKDVVKQASGPSNQMQSLQEVRIEIQDIYLDSKKIGEAQIKLSRY
jgi:hypothetical protein